MEYGASNTILYCGTLEKKRDGAVRGGYTNRRFILTAQYLHYFRISNDTELLGEERGQIPLRQITSTRAKPEDEIAPSAVEPGLEHYYLEIVTSSRVYVMRALLEDAFVCESWSIAIEQQRKRLIEDRSSISNIQTLCEMETAPCPPPQIAMVSTVTLNADEIPVELVIKRHVAYGQTLDLGVIPHGGACVILMQDGSVGRIGTQALMASWDANELYWIDIPASCIEIQVSASCKVLDSSGLAKNAKQSSNQNLPSGLERCDELLSIAFLLMCLFVHLLYGVEGFHYSHKCCLTVGAALAISNILNGTSSKRMQPQMTIVKSAPLALPRLMFTLTIHQFRMKP